MEIELRRLIGLQVIVMGPSFIDNEKLESVSYWQWKMPASGSRVRKPSTGLSAVLKRNPPHQVLPSSFRRTDYSGPRWHRIHRC